MRALISTYDKTGLDAFARGLADLEFQLVASGGTAGDTALRITPPLTITREEAQHGIELIREVTRA